jgi:hypothetical protein
LQRESGIRIQKRKRKRKRSGRVSWRGTGNSIRLRNRVRLPYARPSRVHPSLESDELVGLFSFLFSPSQLHTTPIFFLVQTTFSSRLVRTAALAQCTFTIGSRPILSGESCSHQPGAMFCGRRQTSGDREAYYSVLNRVI